jgi:hypothetical protein
MRKFILTPLIAMLLSFGLTFNLTAQDLMITGVADGDLSGGLPKAIELYVVNDIADLSTYGVSSANNGGGPTGAPEFTFPADAATAGQFIYIATTVAEFNTFFGFDPDYTDAMASINGDDAVELFESGTVIDVFGDVNTDGSGTAWEYADGWAYRVDGTTASATFTVGDWTFGSLAGETDNASAATPFPIGTFSMGGGGLTLPFYETYETWPLANWTVTGSGALTWESDDGTSYGPGSVTEGTLAAMFDCYNAPAGDTTIMTTDVIDMDGAVNPTLSFDYWMDGSADTDLWLKVEMTTDGTTWNEIFYQEQDGNISTWTEESILLSGTTATTQIRITGSSDYGLDNLFVDNLAVEEITCPAPSDLALDSNTATEATLSWTENGSATSWNVIYGAPGFDPTTAGTTEVAGAIPYTITGLSAATEYDVYVQADCGGDLSTMDGPVNFTTTCNTYAAPFTEDFENAGAIPTCWMQGAANLENWEFTDAPGSEHIGDNGTITGSTTSGGYMAWVDDSSPHEVGTELLSPMIDISALTTPELSFYLISNNEGNTNVNFSVDVWDGAAWNNDVYFSNSNTASGGWEYITFDLTSLTITGPIQIRFVVDENNGTDFYDDVAIDDVSVDEAPACPQVSDLALDANTSSEATISWTENGSAASWNVIYGAPGFDPTTAGTTEVASAIPYTITGLTASTEYDVYVQADCGGDLSTMAGPLTFTTDCGVYTPPFAEDFATYVPNCWSESEDTLSDPIDLTASTSSLWTSDDFANNTSNTQSARLNIYGTSREEWLISPQIDLGDGSVPYQLEFDLALTDYGNAAPPETGGTDDVFAVVISTDGGATWTEANVLRRWDNAGSPYVYNDISYTGEHIIIDLSAYTNTVKIAFYGESFVTNADNDLFVDNVEVLETPTCQAPSTLVLENITQTEATLSWTENGTATNWNLVYGAPGFDPTSGGTVVAADAIPYTITGLTAATAYDVYVQSDCGGTLSSFSAPLTINTACDAFAVPYTQDFEALALANGFTYGDCWYGVGPGANDIDIVDDADLDMAAPYSGVVAVEMNDGDITDDTSALVTPELTGLADGDKQIRFYAAAEDLTNVLYIASIDNSLDLSTMTIIDTITFTAIDTWVEFTVYLNNTALIGTNQRLAFVHGPSSYEIGIDDFYYEMGPSCMPPSGLSVSSISDTEATVSWTDMTGSNWNLIYGAPGFDPTTEGTLVSGVTYPYTITGLSAGTEYDVYVQTDCGSGDLSEWAGPVNFITPLCPAADQCDFGFDLFDSYGDGWNGAYIGVMQGGVEVAQIGMSDGETDTVYQALCDGLITDLVWHTGSWDGEVEFTIYDPYSNELLYMDSADTITDGSVFFSFTPSCTEPLTDLALIEPSSGIDCELTASEVIPVQFDNVGETTIASGEIVNFTVTSEGTPMIDEDITLSEDLLPGESWSGTTTGTVDLSAIGTYNWTAAITYAADMNADNDTVEGYIVNFDQEIQFQDAVNDTINVSSYPYTIQPDVVYTPDSASLTPDYLWGGGETLSMLQVNADGWYYLTVTTEGCSVEDSVFVRLDVGMDEFDNSSLAVYPNPNEGQFAVSMTLAERQDVVLTIVSSSGQVVREIKLEDVTSISEDINIEGMADGLYNLRISAGNKQYNRQIVVQ